MTTITLAELTPGLVQELVDTITPSTCVVGDAQRDELATRLRRLPVTKSRVDAWTVERGGALDSDFAWSPQTAKRTLGRMGLAHFAEGSFRTMVDSVRHEVERLMHYAASSTYPSSLALWLANAEPATRALAVTHAVSWATESWMLMEGVDDMRVVTADTYHQVAGTGITLRGCRDAVIGLGSERIVVRLRNGAPSTTAGSGLRADFAVDALAHPLGQPAARFVSLWPDAGLALHLDGTTDALQRGVHMLERCAEVRAGGSSHEMGDPA
jgi:hypothetical protein